MLSAIFMPGVNLRGKREEKSKIDDFQAYADDFWTKWIFPQLPIFFSIIIKIPKTPLIFLPASTAFCMSSGVFTRLHTAVAAASAREADFAIIVAASALPKENEWPTVPEEVHTPHGVSSGFISIASLLDSGEFPANIPIFLGL